MRKNRIIFLFAAIALLAGCAKEEKIGPVGDGHSLTVSLGQTKTHMENNVGTAHKIFWSNGDKIRVNGNESAALDGLGDDVRTATFEFATPLSSTPYNIIYPSSIYTDETHVTLPAVQDYRAGGFAEGMYPMAGYSADGSSVSINHLCSIIKVSVKRATGGSADTDNLVSVTFKGKNNEQVSGSFTVNYSGATLTGSSAAAADKEVRVVKNSTTSTSTAVDYYIVVPAQNYTAGFDIIIQDVNGDIQTKSAGAINMAAGKMYTPDEFAFEPTGMATGIEISSAEDLIAFATAYNNKEYAGMVEPLIATLTADITFDATSSTAFNTTGGIGTPYGGDNYFVGIFNGNSHSISGLTSTVPLFGGIDGGSTVKNFTISNTCTFTFTRPTADAKYYGAVAGYHKGTLSSVSVNANVSLGAVSGVAGETGLGGLAGRLAGEGTIDGCTYSGAISVPSGFATSANNVYTRIGGLVGISLATTTIVKNSHMQGTIDYAGVTTAPTSNSTTAYVTIGGVIGQNKGSITNCDTACLDDDSDGAISYTASDSNTYYATIVNHTTQSHCMALGGIVGYNYGGGILSSCTNRAKLLTNIVADADKKARYFRIGGIAGINGGEGSGITGCDNYGVIINSSTARLQASGGIVGLNSSPAEVSSCTNNSTGTVSFITTGTATEDVRCPSVGGVIGDNQSTNVSDVHNNANLDISCIESDSNGYVVHFGGVIGSNTAAIDGGSATKNITNSGKVYTTFAPGYATTGDGNGVDLGGIVGYSTASVQYAVNKGYVLLNGKSGTVVLQRIYAGGIVGRMAATGSLTGCENKTEGGANDGEVYFYFDNNGTKHTDNYAGGILGYSNSGVNISNCSNAGYIHAGNGGTAKSPATLYVGGIVGYLAGTGSGIIECVNTGNVYNHHRNNSYNAKDNSTYTGGIAGEVVGTSENRISISNCTVNPTSYVSSHRGWLGGVVGYAEYSDISSCSYNKNFRSTEEQTTSYFVGGIAGWALNSTITSCTWSGTTINTTQLQANGAGGIVAQMDGGTLNGCSSSVTTIQKSDANVAGGALVGIALNSPTIKNCHYKATVNSAASAIVASGAFTDGDGNVADL